MQTSLTMPFGDGEYTFKLTLPLIHELQRKTKTGIGALFARVLRGRYQLDTGELFGNPLEAAYNIEDITETIRSGLLGGNAGRVNGMPVTLNPAMVQALMDAYVYPARPISEGWGFAAAILTACIEGYEEPDPGKAGGNPDAGEKSGEATTDGSTGLPPSQTSPSATSDT